MQVELQTYLAETKSGESVFKIEMSNTDCFEWLTFDCNVEIKFKKNKKMKKAIEELYSPELDPEREMVIIQEILSSVTTIEGIRKCKLETGPEEEEFVEQWFVDMLVFLVTNGNTSQYLPFAVQQDSYFFKKFVIGLKPCTNLQQISRNEFEKIIKGHQEIEEEYIINYASESSFFTIEIKDSRIHNHFYIMRAPDMLLIFFADIR